MPTVINETDDDVELAMEDGTKPPDGKIIEARLCKKGGSITVDEQIIPGDRLTHTFFALPGKEVIVKVEADKTSDITLRFGHFCELN